MIRYGFVPIAANQPGGDDTWCPGSEDSVKFVGFVCVARGEIVEAHLEECVRTDDPRREVGEVGISSSRRTIRSR